MVIRMFFCSTYSVFHAFKIIRSKLGVVVLIVHYEKIQPMPDCNFFEIIYITKCGRAIKTASGMYYTMYELL